MKKKLGKLSLSELKEVESVHVLGVDQNQFTGGLTPDQFYAMLWDASGANGIAQSVSDFNTKLHNYAAAFQTFLADNTKSIGSFVLDEAGDKVLDIINDATKNLLWPLSLPIPLQEGMPNYSKNAKGKKQFIAYMKSLNAVPCIGSGSH